MHQDNDPDDQDQNEILKADQVVAQRYERLYERLKKEGTHKLMGRNIFVAANMFLHRYATEIQELIVSGTDLKLIEKLITTILEGAGLPGIRIVKPRNQTPDTPPFYIQLSPNDQVSKTEFIQYGYDSYMNGQKNTDLMAHELLPREFSENCECSNCYAVNLLLDIQADYSSPSLDNTEIMNLLKAWFRDSDAIDDLDESKLSSEGTFKNEAARQDTKDSDQDWLDELCDQLFNEG